MDTDPNEASARALWTTPSGTNVYQIFVECPDGTIEALNVQDYVKLQIETITNHKYLMVAPDDSIAHVKQTIEQRTGGIGKGYAVKDQALFNRLNDEELIDNDDDILRLWTRPQLLFVCDWCTNQYR
eukprot:493619_1